MGQATPIWVRFCAKIIYTKTLRFYELKKRKKWQHHFQQIVFYRLIRATNQNCWKMLFHANDSTNIFSQKLLVNTPPDITASWILLGFRLEDNELDFGIISHETFPKSVKRKIKLLFYLKVCFTSHNRRLPHMPRVILITTLAEHSV